MSGAARKPSRRLSTRCRAARDPVARARGSRERRDRVRGRAAMRARRAAPGTTGRGSPSSRGRGRPPPRGSASNPSPCASSSAASVERIRPSYVSSRSRRTTAAAAGRRDRPLGEPLERERRVRGRAREPRRRPELAHEEPGARLGEVASPRGVDRPLERGVQDRRPDRRTGAGERRRVESGGRRLRVVERAPGGGEIRRATGEHALDRAARGRRPSPGPRPDRRG